MISTESWEGVNILSDVIDSPLDGQLVMKTFPAPAWFGQVIGVTESGWYAVEVWNETDMDEPPIVFVEAESIGFYLYDPFG